MLSMGQRVGIIDMAAAVNFVNKPSRKLTINTGKDRLDRLRWRVALGCNPSALIGLGSSNLSSSTNVLVVQSDRMGLP